ncbi:hypothetical protein BEWA_023930 [Theileria equi strain WA]|uniref:Uncharacterized protein n=1 Tax=Theileria equi strain WA TaxID=1537102 RepID=L0AXC0_THEEQ|nr:hypothetical protein BEWA_023930 [Theileria equi strain WA]AFZ79544.1 hypothetical protein BEWA_023930 [Theileria equi strain WA]|eukprot:XP_004829210.1 hypothetical protein BEWA_023930 [Theileria equi strain WA]
MSHLGTASTCAESDANVPNPKSKGATPTDSIGSTSTELRRLATIAEYKIKLLLGSKKYRALIRNNELIDVDCLKSCILNESHSSSDIKVLELCLLMLMCLRTWHKHSGNDKCENLDINSEVINRISQNRKIFDGVSQIVRELLGNVCIWSVDTICSSKLVQLAYELLLRMESEYFFEHLELYMNRVISKESLQEEVVGSEDYYNQSYYWQIRLVQRTVTRTILTSTHLSKVMEWVKELLKSRKLNIYAMDEMACLLSQIWIRTKKPLPINFRLKLMVLQKLAKSGDSSYFERCGGSNKLIRTALHGDAELRNLAYSCLIQIPHAVDRRVLYAAINVILDNCDLSYIRDLKILVVGAHIVKKISFGVQYINRIKCLLCRLIKCNTTSYKPTLPEYREKNIIEMDIIFLDLLESYFRGSKDSMILCEEAARKNHHLIEGALRALNIARCRVALLEEEGQELSIDDYEDCIDDEPLLGMFFGVLNQELLQWSIEYSRIDLGASRYYDRKKIIKIISIIESVQNPCPLFNRLLIIFCNYLLIFDEAYKDTEVKIEAFKVLCRSIKICGTDYERYSFIPQCFKVFERIWRASAPLVKHYTMDIMKHSLDLVYSLEYTHEKNCIQPNGACEGHDSCKDDLKLSISAVFRRLSETIKLDAEFVRTVSLGFYSGSCQKYVAHGLYNLTCNNFSKDICKIVLDIALVISKNDWNPENLAIIKKLFKLCLKRKNRRNCKIVEDGYLFGATPRSLVFMSGSAIDKYISFLFRHILHNVESLEDNSLFYPDCTIKSNVLEKRFHDCPGE